MAGKSSVDLRTFLAAVVKASRNGQNQSDVARELGVSAAAVSLRLKGLRDRGVKVPVLVSTRGNNTVEDANNILDELMG